MPMEFSRNSLYFGYSKGAGDCWQGRDTAQEWPLMHRIGKMIEKDCTSWAHERLKTELPLVQVDEGLKLKVIKVNSINGDVSVNVRKGRIRQLFDLTIELLCRQDEQDFNTTITDYMSDTDYEGFEFSATALPKEHRESFKRAIWNRLEAFKKEVEEVQGKSLLVQSSSSAEGDQPKPKFNGIFDDKEDRNSKSVESLEENVSFRVPLEPLWAALTDPLQVMMWSRGTAQMASFEPGASFTLLNGNVMGTVTAVVDKKSIRMDWRLKHWPSECVSQVTFSLSPDQAGGTRLNLKQVGIPVAEVESVKENWHRYYWEPIKTILGCSSSIAY